MSNCERVCTEGRIEVCTIPQKIIFQQGVLFFVGGVFQGSAGGGGLGITWQTRFLYVSYARTSCTYEQYMHRADFEKSGVRLWGIAATAATGLQTNFGVPPPRWGHHGINSGKKSRMRPSEISLSVENTF